MQPDDVSSAALTTWLTEKTLTGVSETEIVGGFCERLVRAGVPLARAIVPVNTLHPIYEGRAFRWSRGTDQAEMLEYGRTREGEPRSEVKTRCPHRSSRRAGSLNNCMEGIEPFFVVRLDLADQDECVAHQVGRVEIREEDPILKRRDRLPTIKRDEPSVTVS